MTGCRRDGEARLYIIYLGKLKVKADKTGRL